jgi:hypothetical protein
MTPEAVRNIMTITISACDMIFNELRLSKTFINIGKASQLTQCDFDQYKFSNDLTTGYTKFSFIFSEDSGE